jgi:iron complex transport system substrate-binding protein
MLYRRDVLGLIGGFAALVTMPKRVGAEGLVSNDIPVFSTPPKRILLGDGHLLLALALVHPNPVDLICAWQGDLVRHSKDILAHYSKEFPSLLDLPVVGEASPDTFSVEAALASRPDVALFGGCYGPGREDTAVIRRFESAGVPVVFADFYEDPLRNTASSMRLIGKLLGGDAQQKAERFAQHYETAIANIQTRISLADPHRPTVMVQANAGAPGWGCCWVPGNAGLGKFIELAGGENIGASLSGNRPWVQARRELVLTLDPDYVFVTGGGYLKDRSGLVIGPGVSSDEAHTSLRDVATTADTNMLTAFNTGRLSGLWHLLHATPFNVVAAQAIAKRIHPDLFADLDAADTIAVYNRDYLAVPLEGSYSVDMLA